MTFLLMAVHFFFGSLHDMLRKAAAGSFFSRYSFIIPFLLCLLLIAFWIIKKRNAPFTRMVYYLNILCILLLAMDSVWLVSKMAGRKSLSNDPLSTEFKPCKDCPAPDIYFIIADEYAGNRQLKDLFQFDNSAFLSALKQKGFHIIENSRSNYNYTPYSIASALNMDYLNQHDKQPLLSYTYETIRNNRLLRFLQQQQYRFYNFTHFDFRGQPAQTAETFLPAKTRLITGQTFLSRIEKEISYHLITTLKWDKEIRKTVYFTQKNNELLYQQTIRATKEKTPGSKFVLTHLMMPHYPYYFDKNGNEYPFEQLTEGNQNNYQHYIEYLQYCNQKLLELIDQILKGAPSPPVIVLMGDHGFRHFKGPVDTKYYFSNLLTVHLPGRDYAPFHDSLSNVNFVRALLNTSFRQQLPYLQDTTFIMENP
ncbi:MAG: hypothetical protein JNK14_00630 [Chitinophagaceae bacterium]|nr:hypothetical protein [Chitinophagaceae bacterium]